MTVQELQAELDKLDAGVLLPGSHPVGSREFCALEFESQVRGRPWSDSPITLPDLRPLNDSPWSSDRARTTALLSVMSALWDWSIWSPEQQQQWIIQVVVRTIQEIISALPNLPDASRTLCREAHSLKAAWAAARAAADAGYAATATDALARAAACAADAAACAACAADAAACAAAYAAAYAAANTAARAAGAAAHAVYAAARTASVAAESVLNQACQIWIDAAKEINGR